MIKTPSQTFLNIYPSVITKLITVAIFESYDLSVCELACARVCVCVLVLTSLFFHSHFMHISKSVFMYVGKTHCVLGCYLVFSLYEQTNKGHPKSLHNGDKHTIVLDMARNKIHLEILERIFLKINMYM